MTRIESVRVSLGAAATAVTLLVGLQSALVWQISTLRGELANVRGDVRALRWSVEDLRTRIASIEDRMNRFITRDELEQRIRASKG